MSSFVSAISQHFLQHERCWSLDGQSFQSSRSGISWHWWKVRSILCCRALQWQSSNTHWVQNTDTLMAKSISIVSKLVVSNGSFHAFYVVFFPLEYILSISLCSGLCAIIGFRGLKFHVSVTQSPKYTRLKRITNQFSFVYTVVKSLYMSRTECKTRVLGPDCRN